MAKELHSLGWDYLMFALFVAFTVFTPLWKRLFGKAKQRSKADYVFATGGVSLIAVMISIARGTLGVRTVLGKCTHCESIPIKTLCQWMGLKTKLHQLYSSVRCAYLRWNLSAILKRAHLCGYCDTNNAAKSKEHLRLQ